VMDLDVLMAINARSCYIEPSKAESSSCHRSMHLSLLMERVGPRLAIQPANAVWMGLVGSPPLSGRDVQETACTDGI
jgi:hypothetical protein